MINVLLNRAISWFLYRGMNNPVKAARFLGVNIGSNCEILDDPWKVFGSEPYLVTIGDHVEITNGVRFDTHDGAVWVARLKPKYKDADAFQEIVVGNNVFIGINSVLLPGTTIGNNVVIGAGSVISGHLASEGVYAGVPAKRIKSVEEYLTNKLKDSVNTHGLSAIKKKRWLVNHREELRSNGIVS